mmetsp:Transcript_19708/g.60971  ORF Transcript_19708/g.60971 Transcript_19708/m.60971 type:complete len:327 (+) Transcript_19708:95-1075(+)
MSVVVVVVGATTTTGGRHFATFVLHDDGAERRVRGGPLRGAVPGAARLGELDARGRGLDHGAALQPAELPSAAMARAGVVLRGDLRRADAVLDAACVLASDGVGGRDAEAPRAPAQAQICAGLRRVARDRAQPRRVQGLRSVASGLAIDALQLALRPGHDPAPASGAEGRGLARRRLVAAAVLAAERRRHHGAPAVLGDLHGRTQDDRDGVRRGSRRVDSMAQRHLPAEKRRSRRRVRLLREHARSRARGRRVVRKNGPFAVGRRRLGHVSLRRVSRSLGEIADAEGRVRHVRRRHRRGVRVHAHGRRTETGPLRRRSVERAPDVL